MGGVFRNPGVRSLWLAALLQALPAVAGLNAQAPVRTIVLSGASGDLRLIDRRGDVSSETVVKVQPVQIGHPYAAAFEVRGLVSSLYSCAIAEKSSVAPEIAALRGFFSLAGPLLLDPALVSSFRGAQANLFNFDKSVASSELLRLLNELVALRDLIEVSVPGWRLDLRAAAKQFAELPPEGAASAASAAALEVQTSRMWKQRLRCSSADECAKAKLTDRITHHLREIARLAGRRSGGSWNKLEALALQSSAELLSRSDELLAIGSEMDTTLAAFATAKPFLSCGPSVTMSWREGREVTVTVAPRALSVLNGTARNAGFVRAVSLRPRWAVSPSFGAAALFIDRGLYDRFGATTIAGASQKRVFVLGTQDARLLYGVTLGLTGGSLDRRQRSGFPVTVWPLEVTVQPLETNRAFGLGTAASLGIVKVGTGALWIRHAVLLDGLSLGDSVLDANLVRTRDRFTRPKLYVSFALIGLPPFTR